MMEAWPTFTTTLPTRSTRRSQGLRSVTPGKPDIAVTVTVPVDGGTLDRLTERAEREDRDIEQVVADALRAAAA